MVEASTGSGEALAPTVVTESNVAPTAADKLAEMNAKTKAEALENARRGVASAAAKVTRQQEHLDGAAKALANAQAELAALESEA